MRFTLIFMFLLVGFQSFSQDLTGIWRGHFRSTNRMLQMMNLDDRYKFEVQLDQHGKAFEGVTYSYKTTEFYGKALAKGTIHTGTKKVILEELKIVELRMRQGNDACIMTCFMQYSKSGDEEFLEGTYVSMNTRDSSDCGRGTLFLRKVPVSDFYKEPFLANKEKEKKPPAASKPLATTPKKTDSKSIIKAPPAKKQATPPIDDQSPRPLKPKVIPNQDVTKKESTKTSEPVIVPPVLKNRENELVKVFVVHTREVIVNLYDNGIIDHDTVSVYLNKKLVISKQELSLSPIVLKIAINDDNEYQELVMVAENLGDIPPNTSLMVVKAGPQQFEARITSTEQKNAVVRFKYEKEQ